MTFYSSVSNYYYKFSVYLLIVFSALFFSVSALAQAPASSAVLTPAEISQLRSASNNPKLLTARALSITRNSPEKAAAALSTAIDISPEFAIGYLVAISREIPSQAAQLTSLVVSKSNLSPESIAVTLIRSVELTSTQVGNVISAAARSGGIPVRQVVISVAATNTLTPKELSTATNIATKAIGGQAIAQAVAQTALKDDKSFDLAETSDVSNALFSLSTSASAQDLVEINLEETISPN